jgi:hypothetical protein
VAESNRLYDEQLEKYKTSLSELSGQIKTRKEQYKLAFGNQGNLTEGRTQDMLVVPTDWIRQWVQGQTVEDGGEAAGTGGSSVADPVLLDDVSTPSSESTGAKGGAGGAGGGSTEVKDVSSQGSTDGMEVDEKEDTGRRTGGGKDAQKSMVKAAVEAATEEAVVAAVEEPKGLWWKPMSYTLCPHNKLPPREFAEGRMKRIPLQSWSAIVHGHDEDAGDGYPLLMKNVKCKQCEEEYQQGMQSRIENTKQQDQVFDALEQGEPTCQYELEEACYISRKWISLFKTAHGKSRQKKHSGQQGIAAFMKPVAAQQGGDGGGDGSGDEGDSNDPRTDVNMLITCPHDSLFPNKRGYRAVSRTAWETIHAMFSTSREFACKDTKECEVCQAANQETKGKQNDEKEKRQQIISNFNLKPLLQRCTQQVGTLVRWYPQPYNDLIPPGKYYLVERRWLTRWRDWMQSTADTDKPVYSGRNFMCMCEAAPSDAAGVKEGRDSPHGDTTMDDAVGDVVDGSNLCEDERIARQLQAQDEQQETARKAETRAARCGGTGSRCLPPARILRKFKHDQR